VTFDTRKTSSTGERPRQGLDAKPYFVRSLPSLKSQSGQARRLLQTIKKKGSLREGTSPNRIDLLGREERMTFPILVQYKGISFEREKREENTLPFGRRGEGASLGES